MAEASDSLLLLPGEHDSAIHEQGTISSRVSIMCKEKRCTVHQQDLTTPLMA